MFDSKPSTPNVPNAKPKINKDHIKLVYNFGLNDYKGNRNDLRGCVNDAIEWRNLYHKYGYESIMVTDKNITKEAMIKALENLVNLSHKYGGDFKGAFTFSGHGTHVEDLDGDEENGRDEAFALYDGLLIDDDVRHILRKFNSEARLTVIADCCHSGTITRSFLGLMDIEEYVKPRFLPPADGIELNINSVPKHNLFIPEDSMNEVLLTGCNPVEYSYDAYLGGKFIGAMTFHATNILKQRGNITFNELHKSLRKNLPTANHPQSPQLEGREENKEKLFF